MNQDEHIKERVAALSDWLADKVPEAGAVIKKLRAGEIEEQEALIELLRLTSDADLMREMKLAASKLFSDGPTAKPTYELAESKGSTTALWSPKEGVTQLNPLHEAAIAERAQFDGDVPEARRGAFKEGMTPAIPVDTDTMNPMALGAELEAASDEILEEIESEKTEQLRYLESVSREASLGDEAALVVLAEGLPEPVSGVERYRAGEKPQPLTVQKKEGTALLDLSNEDRKRYAFKGYSTTQGRRSALTPLEKAVKNALADKGVEIDVQKGSFEDPETLVSAAWTMPLGHEGSTQPNFSYLATAARSLANHLAKAVEEHGMPDNPVLQLATVDAIAERVVGWKARIVSESHA